MIKKVGKFFPIFFAFLAITFSVKGQRNEIGFGLGATNYTGEISPKFNPLFFRPAGNLFYRRNFSPVVAARAMVTLGMIYANEKKSNRPISQIRDGEFTNTVSEFSLLFEYNFFNFRAKRDSRKYIDTKIFSPYLVGGIGIFNLQDEVPGEQQQTSSEVDIAIPFGVGVKYKLTEYLNLGFEFVARKTFNDYIDGVSYGQPRTRITGNPKDKDWYYYAGFTFSYTFYGISCPEF